MLDSVLGRLPRPRDPDLLVGYDTADDAGVYRLSDKLALVETVDFFTPIVDDPDQFGRIAAANSLSDVYAMGGRPILALAILGVPPATDPDLIEAILRGGIETMTQAGCTVGGGHSIRDDELTFGYAVSGLIDPQHIWRNVGARPGDALLLTKPLGTGVIATALKNGAASAEMVAAAAASMIRLNRDAADALRALESSPGGAGAVHAVTDVTGFGFLGHAREMAVGSSVSLQIQSQAFEFLPGALDAARAGHLAGGLKSNREFLEGCVEFDRAVGEECRDLLFDPQTSGGLLAAIEASAAQLAEDLLGRRGVLARRIGCVLSKCSPLIRVE